MAYTSMESLRPVALAFEFAFRMIEKHTETEMKRKRRVILKGHTTYRERLEIENDKLFAVVEADFITQPMEEK